MGSALVKRVAEGALWIALALFLGSGKAADQSALRIIAAAIVALPTAWAFTSYLLRPFEQLTAAMRDDLENILQDQLLAIHAANAYPDAPRLSFHVWTLPQWYQTVLNFKWYRRLVKWKRERYEEEGRRSRRAIDPTLRRAARFGFQKRQPTGVDFRNGEGILGRCIRKNLQNEVLTVALDSADFQNALDSEQSWIEAPPRISQNLRRRPAQKLAAVYGQVAAQVLQRNGHAIGCITLDLPPNSDIRLTDHEGNQEDQPIIEHLKVARELIERRLTH